MMITCSRCGQHRKFRYSASAVNTLVSDGWGSYGSALYCPECTKTWSERNFCRDMPRDRHTVDVIDGMHGKERENGENT